MEIPQELLKESVKKPPKTDGVQTVGLKSAIEKINPMPTNPMPIKPYRQPAGTLIDGEIVFLWHHEKPIVSDLV